MEAESYLVCIFSQERSFFPCTMPFFFGYRRTYVNRVLFRAKRHFNRNAGVTMLLCFLRTRGGDVFFFFAVVVHTTEVVSYTCRASNAIVSHTKMKAFAFFFVVFRLPLSASRPVLGTSRLEL